VSELETLILYLGLVVGLLAAIVAYLSFKAADRSATAAERQTGIAGRALDVASESAIAARDSADAARVAAEAGVRAHVVYRRFDSSPGGNGVVIENVGNGAARNVRIYQYSSGTVRHLRRGVTPAVAGSTLVTIPFRTFELRDDVWPAELGPSPPIENRRGYRVLWEDDLGGGDTGWYFES
jgi:hypothetical protein